MRARWWIAVLSAAAGLGMALPSQARGIKDLLQGSEKKAPQERINLCIKERAWLAYFQNDEGELSPVRDTLNTDNDEDWIGLRFTDYYGPRIRLGVLKVINKSAGSDKVDWTERIKVPISGIQEMLTEALYNTKRFDVIEQKRFQEDEAQQGWQDALEPSSISIIDIGKVTRAQYLIYGTVNEWNPNRVKRRLGLGRFVKAKKEAAVAITFTLADVATGQIFFTTSERVRLGRLHRIRGTQSVPLRNAVRACANKAAFKISTFLRNRKWKGSVIEIKGPDLYINAGSQTGMALQNKLLVQSFRGIIKDEDGTPLGEDLRGIGTLEVIAVQDRFSVARVVEGCKGIKIGDRVELAINPTLPPLITECAALESTLFH